MGRETSLGQPRALEAASKEAQRSGLRGGRQKRLQNLTHLAGLLPSLGEVTVELGASWTPSERTQREFRPPTQQCARLGQPPALPDRLARHSTGSTTQGWVGTAWWSGL